MAVFHVLDPPVKSKKARKVLSTDSESWDRDGSESVEFLENDAQLIVLCFDFQTDFFFFGPHKIDHPAQPKHAKNILMTLLFFSDQVLSESVDFR